MIKLHFCRSSLPGALLIQAALFSRWNHVAVEVDGVVYDATVVDGVSKSTPESLHGKYREIESVTVSGLDERAVVKFLESQLGKSYDWTALIALPFRKDWQNPDKWFCSELAAEALVAGGWERLNFPAYRVTPRDLRILV